MRRIVLAVLLLSVGLFGVYAVARPPDTQPLKASRSTSENRLRAAPVARSNWAVARSGDRVFAFYGLGPGKTPADIAKDVHALDLRSGQWKRLGDVPVAQGRLASAAVTVAGAVYVIGGYTVSPTGAEASTPEILRFDPGRNRFEVETTMPVPVDDTVAMAWRDRWIVLVSGWHDSVNVTDVQLYDVRTKRWTPGTPWPGDPVFGHAGGLVDDSMVLCDGVTATRDASGKNRFAITNACWKGTLDPLVIGRIRWDRIPPHPGAPLYRAGALGTGGPDRVPSIVFAGGSHRPYNYNGVGYDGLPAEPSSTVFAFEVEQGIWREHGSLPEAGMDFRGLVEIDGAFVLLGGMRAGQQVSDGLIRFELKAATEP